MFRRVAGVLVTAVLGLAPSVDASGGAVGSAAGTADSTAPASRLVERPCDVDVKYGATGCYWLEVPERRDIPNADTIRLWVAVIHQPGPDAEMPPVLDITGGPGVPTSTYWVNGGMELNGADSRTLIVMDQRGTGRSEPRIACPEFADEISPTASWADRVADRKRLTAACRARLVAGGVDLNGYDTVENAADYVDLRRALGAEQFFLRGESYAGRLIREIYRQDPDGVAGMLLDSPLTMAPQGPASSVARADAAIARLTEACAVSVTCAELGPLDELLREAASLLDADPLEIPDTDIVIDGGLLYAGVFQAMFDTNLIPALPGLLEAFAGGDFSAIPAAAEGLLADYSDDPDVVAWGLTEVATCADDAAAFTDADRDALADPGVWETFLLDGAWGFGCDVWAVDPVPGGRIAPIGGNVPVLVFSGGLDPVTPTWFAEEVLEGFPAATHVVVPAGGHGVAWNTPCTMLLSLAFTNDPSAPLPTGCVEDLPRPFSDD